MDIVRRLLAIAATTFCVGALAQPWPAKPIRIVVPFPAGGGTDIIARETSQRVATTTGWTFVIDNKPGAGGNLGVDAAAKSPADGYTLVLGQTSNLAINPSLYARMPFRTPGTPGADAAAWPRAGAASPPRPACGPR